MPERPACPPGCGCSIGNEFGEAAARHDLRSYRKSGSSTTTRWLVDGLTAGGVEGLTVLDIGAGVGAAHQALLAAGAAAVTDVDGSAAYVAVAREEAERIGTADRVTYEVGDFVELASSVAPADLVVLDRVICCYPQMEQLVRASLAHARLRYGLVYPRDSWWIRAGFAVLNGIARLVRVRTRAYIHRTAAVEAIIREAGFVPRLSRWSLVWQVVVYERSTA
jgi:magnesium-protoporphyrin O-methyltransferase